MRNAHLNAKERIRAALEEGRTFSVAQGRRWFGAFNISARIAELRDEGMSIYTNLRHRLDGSPVKIYRLGTPTTLRLKAAQKRDRLVGRRVA